MCLWASSRRRTVSASAGAAASNSDQLGMGRSIARTARGVQRDVEHDQAGRAARIVEWRTPDSHGDPIEWEQGG